MTESFIVVAIVASVVVIAVAFFARKVRSPQKGAKPLVFSDTSRNVEIRVLTEDLTWGSQEKSKVVALLNRKISKQGIVGVVVELHIVDYGEGSLFWKIVARYRQDGEVQRKPFQPFDTPPEFDEAVKALGAKFDAFAQTLAHEL
ncbi:hypothetical protein [Desulfovibrio inopinatus]|uniref:hypothetical protein n=1 Tax=Desulfovibrio inopinatus TaxID=102109 RepID=UPI0003FD74E5|nr:hypothetical protein [Desulfovibrio inopinatus]